MIIDQELIKKYHLDQCTPQEAAAIEDWLFGESGAGPVLLPSGESKSDHKAVMWTAISAHLYASPAEEKVPGKKRYSIPALQWAVASSVLLFMVGAYFYFNKASDKKKLAVQPSHYSIDSDLQANGLYILLGDKSKAIINPSSNTAQGTVEFCGMILLNPEKDMQLTLHAQCLSKTDDSKIQNLKKGQRYIAFNYKFNSTNEVIVVNENNLTNLPPVLQREIMKQFNI